MTKKVKQSSRASVLGLMAKFSERLDSISSRLTAVGTKAEDAEFIALKALNNTDKQNGINLDITESLYKLRDSTQKGFDGVRGDMQTALASIQKLNERIGQLESQNLILVSQMKVLQTHFQGLATWQDGANSRISVLESTNQSLRDLFAGEDTEY